MTETNREPSTTIHASAVLLGSKAALVRGPSGSGKSRLAWELIAAGGTGTLPFTCLVADDRALVEARGQHLLVRPAPELAGLIEVYGLGIRQIGYESLAAVGLVVDLAAEDAVRHPGPKTGTAIIAGITLPRLAVAPGAHGMPALIAILNLTPAGD